MEYNDIKNNKGFIKSSFAKYILRAKWFRSVYHFAKIKYRGITKLPFTRRLFSLFTAKGHDINAITAEHLMIRTETTIKMGYPPWERRKNLLGKFRAYVEADELKGAVKLAVYHYSDAEFDCAILENEKKSFLSILRKMADDLPELEVLTGQSTAVLLQAKVGELNNADIYEAAWCKVGLPVPWDKAKNGYVRFLFIAKEERGFLALYRNARKVDWNEEFMQLSVDLLFTVRDDKTACHVGEVDVVYTWVDAADQAWQQERAEYSAEGSIEMVSAANDERYLDRDERDELKYSLRSLYLYAPFIRNIYIVTANQVPSWLNTALDKVRLVSHSDIFPEEIMLPTFNSHSIEACLHRIEGLSEYFIYFNDDMFLGREVSENDFFTKAGLLKIYLSGTHRIYGGVPLSKAIPTDWAAYNANTLIKKDFGLYFDRKLKHYPYALKKSIFEEIEQKYPQEIRQTRLSKVRLNHDLALPSMFSAFFSIATKQGVEWPDQAGEYVYADTGDYNFYKNLPAIANNRPRFFCLNSTRQRDIQPEQQAQLLKEFLDSFYPTPSPFEKNGVE